MSINTLAFAEDCCITGSDDGVLRVWPLDFSTVLMETDVQEPVLCVDVASNETVLCVTQVQCSACRSFEFIFINPSA